ncbi:FAD-dependent monooxygenase [Nonomuraea africana]|uniref:2-polyprenyl-6-methoxyphenol hydroxylase-like FAD-dependent oxidoreductase n=1 Tax=Nonomuraea africana TaxID=46171 RepID=A0ABR9KSW4_9ACTN|nr:FAD-dependent monooxygenase [Nonomuraea africana]MBE1564688.1 2-polyprenyl-6-methoxyphenol hydroxylase-like FAD-dependent oxidoreductase [Nonomuraea africana]
MTNTTKHVLISGAGLAGPAMAYWLVGTGHTVTVVERAPALREGGQAVDFRGAAHMTMLERMGILEEVHRRRTEGGPLVLIDGDGVEQLRLPASFTGGAVEITRGDLSHLLHDLTRERAEYVFGDSIAAMTETADGVDVVFDSGTRRTFDLVIGADGLHSNVRGLAFGEESRFLKSSGYHAGLFDAPNHLGLVGRSLMYSEPGRGALVYPSEHDSGSVTVMCVFASGGLEVHHRDVDAQKRLLAAAYEGAGWELPKLLAHLESSNGFYFDSISQIRMDHFTSGRVALVGDAGYGATMGGMGAGMSLIAAYVLAGELAEAGGDHRVAFARYEERIRGYAKACQRVAEGAGGFFAPKNVRRRNRIYKILASSFLVGFLDRLTTKAADSIELKDYRFS